MKIKDPATGDAHTTQQPPEMGRAEPLPGGHATAWPSRSWVRRIDKRVPGFSEDEQTILGSASDCSA